MTDTAIEKMQAGRELDVLVAERIMGFTVIRDDDGIVNEIVDEPNESSYFISDDDCEFSPSTSWDYMHLVVKEMQRRGFEFHMRYRCTHGDLSWNFVVRFKSDDYFMYPPVSADTAPYAVALAALKALEEL